MATLKVKKAAIQNLLASSDRAVERALVALHARQTSDEQVSMTTKHVNRRGFSQYDAEFGSKLAEVVRKGYRLTPKQVAAARKMVSHYWRQLIEVADQTKSAWWERKMESKHLNGYEVSVKDASAEKYLVENKFAGKVYVVTLAKAWNGARCSCPAGVFSHSKECKHVVMAREFAKLASGMQPMLPGAAEVMVAAAVADGCPEDVAMKIYEVEAENAQEVAAFLSDPDYSEFSETEKALVEGMGFKVH
jgi:hypothetical protein